MNKTWMPGVAGILDIIGGAFQLLVSVYALVHLVPNVTSPGADYLLVLAVISFSGCMVTGTLAIVGGVYAVRRKKWSLALAASIVAFFPPVIAFGFFPIPAQVDLAILLILLLTAITISFVALSKKQFKQQRASS